MKPSIKTLNKWDTNIAVTNETLQAEIESLQNKIEKNKGKQKTVFYIYSYNTDVLEHLPKRTKVVHLDYSWQDKQEFVERYIGVKFKRKSRKFGYYRIEPLAKNADSVARTLKQFGVYVLKGGESNG